MVYQGRGLWNGVRSKSGRFRSKFGCLRGGSNGKKRAVGLLLRLAHINRDPTTRE